MNILIIEDDESFAKVLQIRLRSWKGDAALTNAKSLEQARAILNQEGTEFDLIIMDQHLPDGLGADLFDHPKVQTTTVLAVSADESPEVPARAVKAGAHHFLGKRQVTEALFIPLLEALLERQRLAKQLRELEIRESKMESIKTLLATLRHEINNPLGAVFGGTYLIRSGGKLAAEQEQALELVEASSSRIKHVLEQLCAAAELEQVTKANERVFHVPGDAPWGSSTKKVSIKKRQ